MDVHSHPNILFVVLINSLNLCKFKRINTEHTKKKQRPLRKTKKDIKHEILIMNLLVKMTQQTPISLYLVGVLCDFFLNNR